MKGLTVQPDPRYWAGKRVGITGGAGFLGWQLTRLLLPVARLVRVFGLRPASEQLNRAIQSIDCVFGDVRDAAAMSRTLGDCDVIFHTAGTVGVWGRALEAMHEIHRDGTRNALNALAPHARLVHTSSVVAVGATTHGAILDESSPFELHDLKVDYVHAKRAAEEVAIEGAARRDIVVVNPGYLLGPDDFEASVMGRLCLRCWRGKMPMIPPGGLNFVDVRDVAMGHVLAAERSERGRRYILGGDNLSMPDFVRALALVRGQAPRWWPRMPGWLYTTVAAFAELRSRIVQREPYPSFQHVRMSRYLWYYTSDRARRELGYDPRPLARTLEDTHRWYCETGQLKPLTLLPTQSDRPRREAA